MLQFGGAWLPASGLVATLDRDHRQVASGFAPLSLDAPRPLWREQHPAQ